MRNQVIKISALLLFVGVLSRVESTPGEGRKVVVVLPYYKHEVQTIYFKQPTPSEQPPNQEHHYENPPPGNEQSIKVWVEKRPPSADRGRPTGFPYNYNANSGVLGSVNETPHGNRGVPSGWQGNRPQWTENQPAVSGNPRPWSGNQAGVSTNPRPWSQNQSGYSGYQTQGLKNQGGFQGNQFQWSENQAGFLGSQPPLPGNPFQSAGYPGGEFKGPGDSYSSSWSSINVFPANQGKPQQVIPNSANSANSGSRVVDYSAGKQAQGWNVAWKSNHPHQGGPSRLHPPVDNNSGGRPQWENQGGFYSPGGENGWKTRGPPGNSIAWQTQGSPPGVPNNGNGNAWNQDVNGREYTPPGGNWETQTQEEWEKHQQAGKGNVFTPPDSTSWRDESVFVSDEQKWPTSSTPAAAASQGWVAANEVNDALSGGCPPEDNGNNCFREANNLVRVRNNHQDGFNSEKSPNRFIDGWDAPLASGEGNAVRNYEEVSYQNGNPNEMYVQRENSYSGIGFDTKGKSNANNLNAGGINNNYRFRESHGVSSNIAAVDKRSVRNGKQASEDAEIFVAQDSYGVVINHGNSDFYKNARKAEVASAGKFPGADSYAAATFGGVKTRVKVAVSGKEKRAKSTATASAAGEFGKKLKGVKREKKAGVQDLSTS